MTAWNACASLGRLRRAASLLGAVTAMGLSVPMSTYAQSPSGTPSSASAMKEMHGDWAVTCADRVQGQAHAKACVVSQTQVDPKTHERVVKLEVAPALTSSSESAATVLMPFGLVLDRGVVLQIDNAAVGAPARFQTCLPMGCVVQLRLDSKTLSMLRDGINIKLIAVAATDGKRMLFTIPLKGLGAAVDRATALAKS